METSREVKNIKDSVTPPLERLLLVGGTGVGKTTAFATLPGRKFLYIFDPNSLPSLRGGDVEYLEFLPDVGDLDISIKTLKREGDRVVGDKPKRPVEPRTYVDWEKDYTGRVESGFFNDYAWIGFDSFTTLADMVMDRVLWLSKRLGKHPEQPDWTAQMNTLHHIFRLATNMRCNVFCTAHIEVRKDDVTGRTYGHIMMTGRLRIRLPLLFNNIWACHCESTREKDSFSIQTRPDKNNPTIRCSIPHLRMYEDVTVDFNKDPEGQGVGGLLLKAGRTYVRR